MRTTDLTGRRFGRLVVLAEAAREPGSQRRWLCLCDCGVEKKIQGIHLTAGRIESCRCLQRERAKKRFERHGLTKSPEYLCWCNIRRRCANTNDPNYGGRGITVAPEWLDFNQFYTDMGPRPSRKHSIDRIDNEGSYAPGNCRWATRAEQRANQRTTYRIEFDGRRQTAAQWGAELGLNPKLIVGRGERGWTPEMALTTDPDPRRWLDHNGTRLPISEWAKRTGLPIGTLYQRLNKLGWSVDKTLTTALRQTRRTR